MLLYMVSIDNRLLVHNYNISYISLLLKSIELLTLVPYVTGVIAMKARYLYS